MRVALLQGPAADDVDGALTEVADGAHAAAAAGARILVCAELTCTGYRDGTGPELGPDRATPGPIARAMSAAARDAGITIAYGYAERSGASTDGPTYNAVAVVDADGAVRAHYRKTHLYRPPADDPDAPDDTRFTPGDRLVTQFSLGELTCGILICYDVEFPEAVRAHALAGTDWLLVPTALAAPDDHVATTLVPARAIESQLFITYVNRVGREPGGRPHTWVTYCGRSCAVAPDGTELARAGAAGADLLVTDLDPALLARSRRRNRYLRDRRPELYRALGADLESPR